MSDERDCRTCFHNTYRAIKDCDYVDCMHPVTLARGPRHQQGDPAMVNWRTADVHLRDIHHFKDCPTWEPVPEPATADEAGARRGSSLSSAMRVARL